MKAKELLELLVRPEYAFLDTHERLGNNIAFLTLGGSHAYGTSTPDSDVDVRGVALNSRSDLLGLTNFEQIIDNGTDTVIYSVRKFISLAMGCNPNIIEMFGCRPEHYVRVSKAGETLIANRRLFLSQKAKSSFGGYADQQLRRLQNALARDNYPQDEKEKHILASCISAMRSFNDRYAALPEGSFHLYIAECDDPDSELTSEIVADVSLTGYPLRDYKNLWSDLNSIIKEYGKINQRNRKKDAAHLNKHAMHLVRLFLMAIDILENERIVTYRADDLPLLMDIRNGKYMREDGSYDPVFFEMVKTLEDRMKYAAEHTSLPKAPNFAIVNDLLMAVNESVVCSEMCEVWVP